MLTPGCEFRNSSNRPPYLGIIRGWISRPDSSPPPSGKNLYASAYSLCSPIHTLPPEPLERWRQAGWAGALCLWYDLC